MKSKPTEWLAPDDDNRRLSNLCGPLNKNIEHIEKSLNVKITRRGGRLQVAGDKLPSQQAIAVINKFFALSQNPIEPQDIELVIVELRDAASKMAEQEAQYELDSDDTGEEEAPIVLKTRRVDLQARTSSQKEYLRTILSHDLTFGIGPAGTGKTYLAVACAVDALERDAVRRIVLTRPAVEAGERLGFLPGDLAQKIDPYLRPLYDSLYDLLGYERVQKLFDKNMIEIAPLAYMRGRTLNHAFVILDEAQNTTPEQMKMFLTRIGFGTKAVITGDVTQIDLPRGQKSGLIQAQQVLKDVPEIGFSHFMNKDVVRHPLVGKIVDAYDHFQKKHEARTDD
ncbi:MAG: PhoH family protein [Burkholderiales bacterium]|nr:PhoH family protein [Burkholderiales bacterium]